MTASPSNPGAQEASILAAALPFMQHYEGKVVVIKYGGAALEESSASPSGLAASFARDIALLRQSGVRPVLVHGGGQQISAWCRKVGIEPVFEQGRRRTGAREVEIAEMVLAGKINKQIVRQLHQAGAHACGLSGSDGNLLHARPIGNGGKRGNDNLTGEIVGVNPELLDLLLSNSVIPVIAPLAPGAEGKLFNINADDVAGALAQALGAVRLMLLTDVSGIVDKKGQLMTRLAPNKLKAHIKSGLIGGGMVPKAETCIAAVEKGVEAAVILDGRIPHALLLELYTPHGAGTLVEKGGIKKSVGKKTKAAR